MAWIGVDFDGTLAKGLGGEPVSKMVDKILGWIDAGIEVRIVTARGSCEDDREEVRAWLREHGLPMLEVTDKKDYQMLQLYDDRARQVLPDTGEVVQPCFFCEMRLPNTMDRRERLEIKIDGQRRFLKISTHEMNRIRAFVEAYDEELEGG